MSNTSALIIAGCLPDILLPGQPFLSGICRARDGGGRFTLSHATVALKTVLHDISQNFYDELIPEF